jgi:hypothetical protein
MLFLMSFPVSFRFAVQIVKMTWNELEFELENSLNDGMFRNFDSDIDNDLADFPRTSHLSLKSE